MAENQNSSADEPAESQQLSQRELLLETYRALRPFARQWNEERKLLEEHPLNDGHYRKAQRIVATLALLVEEDEIQAKQDRDELYLELSRVHSMVQTLKEDNHSLRYELDTLHAIHNNRKKHERRRLIKVIAVAALVLALTITGFLVFPLSV